MKSITFLAIILAVLLVSCGSKSTSTPTDEDDLSNIPADIPMYPDPINLIVLNNSVGYQARADLQTMTEFYQTEMTKQGWSPSQEPITYDAGTIILHYEKDGRKALIDISSTNNEGVVALGVAWE